MITFSVQFLEGHIIAKINKFKYIIDTGSPMSFGYGTTITIDQKQFPISRTGMGGTTIEALSSLSGLEFDGLIGMDILKNFDIRFTQNEIVFSDTLTFRTNSAIKLPIIDTVMDIPIINLTIGQKDRRIVFDTGAKLSYLSDELLTGTSVGDAEDFYPSIGRYKTKVYEVDVMINEKVETLTFGSLPAPLRMLLTMTGTKGIVGSELLKKYSIIYSNSSKMLFLESTNNYEDELD
ncbi:unnamed protein product [Adineta ricciae]|uniref:Peptidase A2 domain-containing protein n=1 Tax=Adineta ricciae TaxID=249248 RepID=A0A814UV67_ADIRI|nr:unnamed protein product [Adineta ricciae]CAF1254157.1 unnamed protein product [Adineta ricciae]